MEWITNWWHQIKWHIDHKFTPGALSILVAGTHPKWELYHESIDGKHRLRITIVHESVHDSTTEDN